MGINALLAQGFNPMPGGMRANALMQQQQFEGNEQKNALARQEAELRQMQMQDAHQQRQMQIAEAQRVAQQAQQQRQQQMAYLDSVSPANGPARPVDPARAMLAGLKPEQITALQGPKPASLMNVAPGGNVFDPATQKNLFTAPFKPEAPRLPPLGELQAYRDGLPQGANRREVDALIANQTRPPKYAGGGGAGGSGAGGGAAPMPKPPKPLPSHALKMQQESLDKIGIASSINADLDGIAKQIEAGKLSFGPVSNLLNTGRNMAGISSEQSRNFGTFKSTLERLRNESLRLNVGVQTDGDAQRAWNELFQNINDTGLVKQRLVEIQAINKRGAELQRMRVDSIRNEYGAEVLDTSSYASQPAAIPGGAQAQKPAASAGKTVVRTGTSNGRKVVQYSDGTTAYAD